MTATQLTLVPAGWYPMVAAPKDCTHVDLLMPDGKVIEDAHWASDLSGEEQPPFEGWFVRVGDYFSQVDGERPDQRPKAWRRRATIGRGSERKSADH